MKEIVIRDNEAGQRFDKFLRKYLPQMPLSAIYKSIRKREITVNGAKSSEKYMLQAGDVVAFKMEVDSIKKEKNMDFLNVEYDFKTAYEDENIVVVQKLTGQLVHPDEGNQLTLTEQVMAYLYDKGEYNPNEEKTFSPSPCNRLDRNTEGLVVFAKNYEALKEMNEGIKNGTVKKYYSTIVIGKLDDGVYTAYVVKNQSSNRVSVSTNRTPGSREIITGITTEDSTGQFSLLEIELITGRSHQIRAHLSYMGNPIVGDPKYGDKKMNNIFKERFCLEGQLLVANKLQLGGFFGKLSYLNGKTITMPLPPLFKKIKNDIFKF